VGLELGAFKFGAASYPLTASTTNTLLQDADPSIHHALAFLSATLHTYFGARLLAQAALHGLALPSAVVATVGIEPEPQLLADQFRLPLFALYRVKDVWDEHTISYDKSTSVWEFAYLLPPLTPVQAKALQPILRAVSVTLRRAIHMGSDPSYLAGTPVWANAGIQKARLVECTYGGWVKVDNLDQYYRALTGTIAVLEREMPATSAYDNFQGADVETDVRAGDGTTLEAVDDFNTYGPPDIVSVAPTSGTSAGGTLVTITGTGFRTGTRPVVLFDGAAADAVTVVNSTSITCRTPPHAAYPSFVADVMVIAADGQSDTLDDAFTFNT
jgi:hypothetical protein